MSSTRQANADTIWIAFLAIGLPFLAMLLMGVDANWDLRNYHLYNAHAWWSGRMAMDIAPAQVQTWHNPLLDVPLYLIVTSGANPRWASAWLTLPCVASIFFLLRLQQALSTEPPSRTSQCVLAVLALTGAATYSTLALSMNDGFVAAAMLGSLLLVVNPHDDADNWKPWLFAGLLAGAVTGLKLAAIFYCLGMAASAVPGGRTREKLRRLGSLAVGGTIGFALTYGFWGWKMFMEHRNPFFPYYNNFFRSPDALPISWADARFRPETWIDALLAPAQLLSRSRKFSELTLSDPRLLLGLLALLALFALYRKRLPTLHRRIAILLAFFVSSFLLWVLQYGIYRYAIVLELLGCLALVLLLQHLPRARTISLLVAALLVSADTKRPDWGHVRSSAPMAGIIAPAIPADSLVLIASGEPLAYFALGLPDSVSLVAVSNNMMSPDRCAGLQQRAERVIAGHSGPIWLLSANAADGEQGQLLLVRHYGLRSAGNCLPLTSAFETARLCLQRLAGASVSACPTP